MGKSVHIATARQLPFWPAKGQVICVDPVGDKRLNTFIVRHYDWLRTTFGRRGLDFCYLPVLGEELIAYHAPHVGGERRRELLRGIPSLASLVARDDGEPLGPSLLYALTDEPSDTSGALRLAAIDTRWFRCFRQVFGSLANDIGRDLTANCKEATPDESGIRFSHRQDPAAPLEYDSESQVLIGEIRERIDALRNRGVNTMILHQIIDEGECVSRLRITRDHRILLPDYDNMEIIIPALPKAVFFLFLRHPEGIRFKDLVDHYDELLSIYRVMNPIGGTQRQAQSIQEITNPLSNSINEKCARIKEAFVERFDDRLARNYYITGKRGEPKRITLASSLVVWEQ